MIAERVQDARESFRACDVLFGCADNDGARLALNEISLKYFIPYIDTGTEIFVEDGRVTDMGGQVRVVVPGVTGCLECAEAIDYGQAAISLLSGLTTSSVRNAAGYVNGTGLSPAPAVITLNTMIASMAAQEFVDMMAGRDRDEYRATIFFMTPPSRGSSDSRSAATPIARCAAWKASAGSGDLPEGGPLPAEDHRRRRR